jgi:hypothetical protein
MCLALAVFGFGGCSDEAEEPAGHSHAGGAGIVSLPVGDGTEPEQVGYSLVDVRLPAIAGRTGEVSFRIEGYGGEPVTEYVEELTKDLHLYVVSSDLRVFRHLHPRMAEDGTWSSPVLLPQAGGYRVVAEFVARDSGGNGDHLVLGEELMVDAGPRRAPEATDPVVEVEATQEPVAGPNGRMLLTVRDARGGPVRLGTYLGAFGHVTGFDRQSGVMLHVHPLTAPETTEDGTTLTFHTEIEDAGDYRLFVQVRVDGYLHTVPVDIEVSGPST